MAERIFIKKLRENNRKDVEVASASLSNIEKLSADSKVVDLLEKKGFNGLGHKPRPLTADMIAEADKILVMEQQQRETIIERYEDATGKTFLLKPFSVGCTQLDSDDMNDIKDPYHLSNYHYRLCFAEIYLAVQGLIKCM